MVLCAVCAWARADPYAQGRAAFLAGDYRAAHRAWSAAVQGDAAAGLAALGLGLLYEKGLGVPRAPREAFLWYRRAAEHGVLEAAYQVGLMLELGEGAARDPGAAEAWYARAIDQGFCPGEILDPEMRIRLPP